jgi:hypothetical protein
MLNCAQEPFHPPFAVIYLVRELSAKTENVQQFSIINVSNSLVYYHASPTCLITPARLQQVYNYIFISKIINMYSRMNQRPAFQGLTSFHSATAWK